MALAEARAGWQRTANRCLVQEDAKRAPKLACCSSMPHSVTQAETGPTSAAAGQDIPTSGSLPFNQNPSCSNLSPNSKWWLQLRPNHGYYQKGLMEEQITTLEGNSKTCKIQESLEDLVRNRGDFGLIDHTTHTGSLSSSQCRNFISCEKRDFSVKEEKFGAFCNWNCKDHLKLNAKEDFGELSHEGHLSCKVLKNATDIYFDSESSWTGAEKNTPWWQTADTEELALLVAQRSLDHVENCDLPRPQNTHFNKDLNINMCCLNHDRISTSSLDQKPGMVMLNHLGARCSAPGSLTTGSSCRKLRTSVGDQLVSERDEPLRDSPTHRRMAEMHAIEDDSSKAQLLEALRHSQTRAREAEKVAKQASAEKEYLIKLVFRQASQLFAYKQWLQLLELENMYFQFKYSKNQSASTVVPVMIPWTPLRTRKMRKSWQKSWGRKRAKRCRPRSDVGKYAVVFAVGLGLIGAGLLLGWTIGWLLPTWWSGEFRGF